MRRWKKEIKDKAVIIDVLNRCHVGRLGTIGKDKYPIVKPLNFAYNPPSPPFSKGGQGRFISTQQRKEKRLKTSSGITGSVLKWICL